MNFKVLMASVHFFHARFIDFRALGDPSLSEVIFMFSVEFLMENFFSLVHDFPALLFVLFESHYKFFEGFFMCFLNDKVFDSWI